MPFDRNRDTEDSHKIINFNPPNITDFWEARSKIVMREELEHVASDIRDSEFEKDEGSEGRCECYHPNTKSLRRELRERNPDSLCCECDGYDEDCTGYNPRK